MEFLLPLILIVLSVIALVAGFITGNVGDFIVAGVLAIFLRIVQAHNQHKDIKRLLGEEPPEKPTKPPSTRDLRLMLEEKQAKESDS